MSEAILLTAQHDRVRLITLNRPEVRNALSGALIRDMRIALASADEDPEVDVIVLTGSDPAFCAGIDLNEMGAPSEDWKGEWSGIDDVPPGYPWVPTAKPVVGAINGAAMTGGFEVALACDVLIASERARFADTHARVGVIPGWGLTARLSALVGHPMAMRMSLSTTFLTAADALAHGLVTEVVDHEQVVPTALELANLVSANWATGGAQLHRLYREAQQAQLAPGLAVEKAHFDRWISGGPPNGSGE